MSTGIVVCSTCRREVHQDGPQSSWQHCDDKTPRCPAAQSVYPLDKFSIVGKFCGRDDTSLQ